MIKLLWLVSVLQTASMAESITCEQLRVKHKTANSIDAALYQTKWRTMGCLGSLAGAPAAGPRPSSGSTR
jgi:hypothetical protein